jgi:probable HAF family extracellular repeat protein
MKLRNSNNKENPSNSRPIKGESLLFAKSIFLALLIVGMLTTTLNAQNRFTIPANSYVFTTISFCDSCSTLPIGINDKGLVSGLYFDADGNLHGFLVRNDNYRSFDVPGALFTEAGRSNERGQIAGDYLAADGIDRPFVRNLNGSFSLRNGAPGASVTYGNDINNRGDVLGWFTLDPNGQTGFQGYVLRGNTFILTFSYPEADVTNTYAIGFNQAGTIVGSFTTTTAGVEHGFVRRAHGNFQQLDFPGSVQTEALGINDDGDIVGRYQDTQGTQHGFLLRDGHFTSIDAPPGPDTFAFGINERGKIVGFTVSASGQDIGFRARSHEREDEDE